MKMKSSVRKAVVLAIGIVVVLIAGCEEQNLPSTRKSRLIAAESLELKKQLEQCNGEIEGQKELCNTRMKKQRARLEKCLQEKKAWRERSQQNIQNQIDGVLTVVMEQNAKLREENERLKARIDKLEKQLEEIKGESGPKPL